MPVKSYRHEISKIVVPYDFTSFSEFALHQAISIAKTCNSAIDLIHVVTPIYVGKNDADLLPDNDIFYSRLIKVAELRLKKIAELVAKEHSLKIISKSYLGIVHQTILKHSKKVKADLIVMGTHGVSGFKEFFLGSNAFRVVNESICPVLTIQRKNSKTLLKKIMLIVTNDTSIDNLIKNVAKLAQNYQSQVIIASRKTTDKKEQDLSIKKMIASAENYFKEINISVTLLTLTDDNFTKAVITHAKKSKADVIAISTTKNFHFNQLISGSYAQQLVNHSSVSILSVS